MLRSAAFDNLKTLEDIYICTTSNDFNVREIVLYPPNHLIMVLRNMLISTWHFLPLRKRYPSFGKGLEGGTGGRCRH